MREASSRTTGRHPPCSPPSGSSPRPGAPPEPVSPPGPRTGRSRPGCHRRARGRSDSRSAFRAEQSRAEHSRAEQSRAEQSRRASRSAAPPEHPEPRQVRGSRRLHPQLSPRGSSGPAPHGSCPHTRKSEPSQPAAALSLGLANSRSKILQRRTAAGSAQPRACRTVGARGSSARAAPATPSPGRRRRFYE